MEMEIVDLPDDCLIHTFNLLGIEDLVAVYETCKRFHSASVQSFARNHNKLEFFYDYKRESLAYSLKTPYSAEYSYLKFDDVKRIIKHFGPYMTSLKIQDTSSGHNNFPPAGILYLARDYCGENLKSICMNYVEIDRILPTDLSNLFKTLEKLEMNCVNGSERIVSICENLTQLSITDYETNDTSLLSKIKNPNLKSFYFDFQRYTDNSYYDSDDSDDLYPRHNSYYAEKKRIQERRLKDKQIKEQRTVYEFLERHPEMISFETFINLVPTTECLQYLKKIESLLIDIPSMHACELSQVDWIGLFQLNNLQHLYLILNHQNIFDGFLSEITSSPPTNIQTLALEVVDVKDIRIILNAFSYKKLTNLKIEFRFNSSRQYWRKELLPLEINSDNLINVENLEFTLYFFDLAIEMVKQTKSLKLLELYSFYDTLTIENFRWLIEIQKSRNSSLTIKHDCSVSHERFNEALRNGDLNGHEDFLKIEYVNHAMGLSKYRKNAKNKIYSFLLKEN